jgi:hypothetical protein
MLLLCTTVQVPPGARERVCRLLTGPIDWEYLLDLAAFHGVVPLLANSLLADDFSGRVPQPFRDWLKRVSSQTLYTNVILSAEAHKVLSAFSQRGIEAIPLKGTVLAEALYGHLGLRPTSDIDILVRPQDLPVARGCLAQMGYEATEPEEASGDHSFHGVPYIKRGVFPLPLELHWALGDEKVVAFSNQEIWRRAQPLVLDGVSTLTLSPEDNLLYLAYHLSKHDAGHLKFLCDIAELLKRHEASLDWDYLACSARSWQMEPALYCWLRRARDLLGAPVPTSWLRTMKPGALRWWLLDLLLSEEALISPAKGRRLRGETMALVHSLMVGHPRRMLAALSRHCSPAFGRGRSLAGPRTAGWIALVLAAGLGRYCRRLVVRP